MTEAEWLTSDDPAAMLAFVGPKLSPRRLRLFACACARLPWEYGLNARERAVIAAAERMADDPRGELDDPDGVVPAAVKAGLSALIESSGMHAAREWCRFGGRSDDFVRLQAALLREVAGDPFAPVTWDCQRCGAADVPGHWTACPGRHCAAPCPWRTPQVLSLAQAAYDERNDDGTLDRLTLLALADALEEAGCDSEDLLWHLRGYEMCRLCRGGAGWKTCDGCNPCRLSWDQWKPWVRLPGPHVRGCWVLSLLLNQE